MKLRKELFWESDFSKIKPDEHKDLIIQRIIDFGTWEAFEDALAYYGQNVFIDSLMNNTELSERGLYFVSHFFDKKIWATSNVT